MMTNTDDDEEPLKGTSKRQKLGGRYDVTDDLTQAPLTSSNSNNDSTVNNDDSKEIVPDANYDTDDETTTRDMEVEDQAPKLEPNQKAADFFGKLYFYRGQMPGAVVFFFQSQRKKVSK